MANMKTQKGFTLAEMLITLSIAGILTSAAIPAYNTVITGSRVETATGSLEDSLHLARSEAITRGAAITVAAASGDGSDWSTGWETFIDRNGDGQFDSGTDTVIQVRGAEDNISIAASDFSSDIAGTAPKAVTYMADGSTRTRGTFKVCASGDADGKTLVVTSVGRSRPAALTCSI